MITRTPVVVAFVRKFPEDRRAESLQERGEEWHARANDRDVAFYYTPVDGGCVVVCFLLVVCQKGG